MAYLLEEAIALAAQAHAGQVDKAGQPYILHVLRVMLRCHDEDARIAAVLHDVVEDCGYLPGDLRGQFGDVVADAVDAVSRRDSETYHDFIVRAAQHPIGRKVKIADLQDNMAPARMPAEPTADDARRQAKYARALAVLMGTTPTPP